MIPDELKDKLIKIVEELQVLAKENKCSFNIDVSRYDFMPKVHILTIHKDKNAVTAVEEEGEKNGIRFLHSLVGVGNCE
jgi:hypothetical protein